MATPRALLYDSVRPTLYFYLLLHRTLPIIGAKPSGIRAYTFRLLGRLIAGDYVGDSDYARLTFRTVWRPRSTLYWCTAPNWCFRRFMEVRPTFMKHRCV